MSFCQRLDRLIQTNQTPLLRGGLKGLEKESLRLDRDGGLAQTPHPRALGSALTHEAITTDYSEALIELITPAFAELQETLGALANLHRFVYSHLGEELLLATSMPIGLHGDECIPIADYGSSNIGRMKRIYREGLGHRYGRTMQSIAGLHYNYSFRPELWGALRALEAPSCGQRDFVDAGYFGVVRNIQRHAWLLIYLFGHSPVMSRSFFEGRESLMTRFRGYGSDTLGLPEATSLRMSDIGYRNDNQNSLEIDFNTLDQYVASLGRAITEPYPPYVALGIEVNGQYRQLNDSILQIENEYYSPVRPKQVAFSGEKPTLALAKRGVRYLEIRVMDLQCFDPMGVSEEAMRFLEVFVSWCLLRESPPLSQEALAECGHNNLKVACCGRRPDREILREGALKSLRETGLKILDECLEVAELLDGPHSGSLFQAAVLRQRQKINEPDHTPSAQVLAEVEQQEGSFERFALTLSRQHAEHWRNRPLSTPLQATFEEEAAESLDRQKTLEDQDTIDFKDFLEAYRCQS